MKERTIGTVFEHPTEGFLTVEREREPDECVGCVFDRPEHCDNDADRLHTGACAALYREDGQGVIFTRKEGGCDAQE